MPANIFSTYSTGENRVTASILAVLESLSLSRIDRLINALLQSSDFELVRFQNQVSKNGNGVPDAVIFSNAHLIIETKIATGAVKAEQLRRHLARFQSPSDAYQRLIVLTPDPQQPAAIAELADKRLVWASFVQFDQAIDALLSDRYEVISEREEFLLRGLQRMFEEEALIGSDDRVVVVAAREAWPEYLEYGAYVCQPDRSFKKVNRIAFYADGEIKPSVAKVIGEYDNVEFTPETLEPQRLRELAESLLKTSSRQPGMRYKVLLLSREREKDTITLDSPVRNDMRTASGRPWAFVLGQRYVPLEALMRAKSTSELM